MKLFYFFLYEAIRYLGYFFVLHTTIYLIACLVWTISRECSELHETGQSNATPVPYKMLHSTPSSFNPFYKNGPVHIDADAFFAYLKKAFGKLEHIAGIAYSSAKREEERRTNGRTDRQTDSRRY